MTSISLSLTDFWIPLLQIIGVNIVLSGDNAVVIAMAARSLAPDQQKIAIFWGSGAAIVMRILLTIFAVKLLVLPYLKLVGAALLLWIGYSLLAGGDDEEIDSSGHLLTAIKTILLADLVMSLDNVIGVAAAAAIRACRMAASTWRWSIAGSSVASVCTASGACSISMAYWR